MQALTLPAGRGWRWLSDGFRIFRKNQLMLSLIVLSYWMLVGVVNIFPILGPLASTLCIPVFSVSLMNACRMIEQGEPMSHRILFSGFEENLRPLLLLGFIYIIAGVGIFGLSALIDEGVLFQLVVLGKKPGEEALVGGDFLLAAQLALLLFAPLMMAYWYAPVLVAWHGLPAGKSLFFSFVACTRNWRAFLAYSVAILVFGALIPGLALGLLSTLLADGGDFSTVFLTLLIVFVLAPTLYASFYVSYRDVFVVINEDA